jgi:hypothetical protein
MHGARIPILCILQQENGEERYNGCAGVDDELPRVRILKHRAANGPPEDDSNRDDK